MVQIKKEQLVHVTRCMATQRVKSTFCKLQIRSGPEQYAKFHNPIVIEPADRRLAARRGRFNLGGKDYLFEMNIRRLVIFNLLGVLTTTVTAE
jgi:hypothetical protein